MALKAEKAQRQILFHGNADSSTRMKLYLTPENSDIYSFTITEKLRAKDLRAFVMQNLLASHPGFGDNTEFDFIRRKDVITAVVVDSVWITEQRLRNHITTCIITVNDKHVRVFTNSKKRQFISLLVLLMVAVLCFLSLKRLLYRPTDSVPIIHEEISTAKPVITESVSRLCQYASILHVNHAELTAITYNCGVHQEFIFSVGLISPQTVVRTINAPTKIDAVSYVDNKPFFTVALTDAGVPLYPGVKPVEQIHEEIETVLSSVPGIELQSAQLNGNGSVSFDIILTKRSLVTFASAISRLTEKHLFFTNSSFINSGNGSLRVSLTAISLDDSQQITADSSALSELTQFFDLMVPVVSKPVEKKIPIIKENTLPYGAVKLGETIHGSIRTTYIRLPDGKIETRTEKVDE